MKRDWIDWHKLETVIPLDDLPSFHRAFLERQQEGENWQAASLRQVQGKVQAALKRLERAGLAKTAGERLLVASGSLPEGYQAYLEQAQA